MEELIKRAREHSIPYGEQDAVADALEAQQARIACIEAARATERAATDAAIEQIKRQQARIAELLSVLKRCYMLDLHDDALLTAVVNAIARTDDLSALAAHDAEVRKAVLSAVQKLITKAGCTSALEWIGRELGSRNDL